MPVCVRVTVCMYACMCVCIYGYMCVCMYVCMCVCLYGHMHSHIHTCRGGRRTNIHTIIQACIHLERQAYWYIHTYWLAYIQPHIHGYTHGHAFLFGATILHKECTLWCHGCHTINGAPKHPDVSLRWPPASEGRHQDSGLGGWGMVAIT